jgi:hypothetical protein
MHVGDAGPCVGHCAPCNVLSSQVLFILHHSLALSHNANNLQKLLWLCSEKVVLGVTSASWENFSFVSAEHGSTIQEISVAVSYMTFHAFNIGSFGEILSVF